MNIKFSKTLEDYVCHIYGVTNMTIKTIALNKKCEENLKSLQYTSTKIRYLVKLGFSPMDIKRKLNIIPQHVYNELDRKCKNPKEETPKVNKDDKIK